MRKEEKKNAAKKNEKKKSAEKRRGEMTQNTGATGPAAVAMATALPVESILITLKPRIPRTTYPKLAPQVQIGCGR